MKTVWILDQLIVDDSAIVPHEARRHRREIGGQCERDKRRGIQPQAARRGIEALVSCVSRVCGFGHDQLLPDVRVT